VDPLGRCPPAARSAPAVDLAARRLDLAGRSAPAANPAARSASTVDPVARRLDLAGRSAPAANPAAWRRWEAQIRCRSKFGHRRLRRRGSYHGRWREWFLAQTTAALVPGSVGYRARWAFFIT
jgi:hypothetical protein